MIIISLKVVNKDNFIKLSINNFLTNTAEIYEI